MPEDGADDEGTGMLDRLAAWFDSRLGLSYDFLRPAPSYSVNPFYWLGALAVVAFVIQGVTGIMMMLYYVPSPTQAYPTTQYIFQNVSYGTFLETVHLYTAYAMIMLAFMHLMRGYFVSVHKKPREAMWVVGMLMGFITLGFGFTGYLLPWTLVSKSATDVGLGMVQALPPPVSSLLTFLIVGSGSDSAELLRFYDLHVVVLPAVLLVLLAAKMYMLEAHGVAEPTAGIESIPEAKKRPIPIFPDMSFYLLELAALFGAAMLILSVAFPLTLPPQYSAALAGGYTAQPDWYFLWIYQILKIPGFRAGRAPGGHISSHPHLRGSVPSAVHRQELDEGCRKEDEVCDLGRNLCGRSSRSGRLGLPHSGQGSSERASGPRVGRNSALGRLGFRPDLQVRLRGYEKAFRGSSSIPAFRQ